MSDPVWSSLPPEALADGVSALENSTLHLLDSLSDEQKRIVASAVHTAIVDQLKPDDAEIAAIIERECVEGGDKEVDHLRADEHLCVLLRRLGYEKTVAAWDRVSKWYA